MRTTGHAGSTPSTVTLYDVARLAGVSTATVSRVVHGQDRVRESTRLRVTQVIEQLGYVPDGAAQSLSRRRKDVIGLICIERRTKQDGYDIENMNLLYYDELLRGVESRIRDHASLSLLIAFVQGGQDGDYNRLRSLMGKVDGLLIAEGVVASPLLARLSERVPVVVIAGAPGEQAVDVVTADNWSGSAALVEHLITEHNTQRLFHVDGPPGVPDARERRLALEQVVRAHRRCRVIGSHAGMFSVKSGLEAGADVLARHDGELPDAIVCGNDQTAIGVLRALEAAGVRVPQDVAVVGFDDIYPGSLSHPPLTTVRQPMGQLGERACDRLLERISDPAATHHIELLPTELVLRASCGCPPGTVIRQPVLPFPRTHPASAPPPLMPGGSRPRPRRSAARPHPVHSPSPPQN
jgi:LacI family transcriptional regulator